MSMPMLVTPIVFHRYRSTARRLTLSALALGLGWALTVALLARYATAGAQPLADLITVTSTNNSGAGTLRQALIEAQAGDTINFSLAANSTIVVSTELTVTEAITLDGSTATNLTISGGGATRVFSVTAPILIKNLTIANGATTGPSGYGGGLYSTSAITVNSVTFVNNNASNRGGGLYTLDALTANSSLWLTNTATGGRGGGAYAEGAVNMTGGGFLNNRAIGIVSGGGLGTSSDAFITGTSFISNTSGDAGGGLRVQGQGVFYAIMVDDNTAGAVGGGAYVAGGATIQFSSFAQNRATTSGGGLLVLGQASITDSVFLTNTAQANGGGIYAGNGLGFANLEVRANRAITDGGGIFVVGLAVEGEDSLFFNNQAGDDGGGLHLNTSALLSAVQFISNTAGDDGGGLSIEASETNLVNLIVARNTAVGDGAGIYAGAGGNITVLHTTLADTANSNAAVAVDGGSATLTNTLFAGFAEGVRLITGTAELDYALFYVTPITATGAVSAGVNSFGGSPNFVDAAGDDYHLGQGSAGVDLGVEAGVTEDFEGDSRPFNSGFDLGADERHAPPDLRMYLPLTLRD